MPAKPYLAQVPRGGAEHNIDKEERNIDKAERNIEAGGTQHRRKKARFLRAVGATLSCEVERYVSLS